MVSLLTPWIQRVARKRVELRASALSQDKVLQLVRELKRDTAFLLVSWT
jgi:hypothetical protein